MNILENPFRIPDSKYHFLMSMLNELGGLAFNPQTCKEVMCRYIGQDVALDYIPAVNHDNKVHGRISQKMPGFVIWLSHKTTPKSLTHTIGQIHDAGHMLAEAMRLSPPVIYKMDKTNACLVVFFDPWYLRSSVAMHGFMTFIRGAASGKHPTSSIYAFIDDIIEPKPGPYGYCTSPDGVQVRRAIENDNLYGFLNKSLPCLNRHRYDDWLVRRNHLPYDEQFRYPRWDGIVGWNQKYESADLFTMDDLVNEYGRYWRDNMNAVPPSDGYRHWQNSHLIIPKEVER